MKKLLVGLVLGLSVSLSLPAMAQTLEKKTFESQFGEAMVLNESVQWVIFAASKDASDWVEDSFVALEITDKELGNKNMMFVADIHKMPALVTRLFALPQMKRYDFSMALDKEGVTKDVWPQKEDQVSVYQLENLNIKEVKFFDNKADIKAFTKEVMSK